MRPYSRVEEFMGGDGKDCPTNLIPTSSKSAYLSGTVPENGLVPQALSWEATAVRSNRTQQDEVSIPDGPLSEISVAAFYVSQRKLYWYDPCGGDDSEIHPETIEPSRESLNGCRDFGDGFPVQFSGALDGGRPRTSIQACACKTVKKLRDYIAVKELPYASDKDKKHAQKEVDMLLRVRHKHIVAYVGSYKANRMGRRKVMIMIYPLAKWNLATYLLDARRESSKLQTYFSCLCHALEYLHAQDIKHRDIKPENVLIDKFHNVLLTDFGNSKHYDDHIVVSNNTTDCTIRYAAREVVQGTPRVGFHEDIFSLGCVFLEMVTVILGLSLQELYLSITAGYGGQISTVDYWTAVQDQKIRKWIGVLHTKLNCTSVNSTPHKTAKEGSIGGGHLVIIEKMMSDLPSERPNLEEIQQAFRLLRGSCENCDTPLPEISTLQPPESTSSGMPISNSQGTLANGSAPHEEKGKTSLKTINEMDVHQGPMTSNTKNNLERNRREDFQLDEDFSEASAHMIETRNPQSVSLHTFSHRHSNHTPPTRQSRMSARAPEASIGIKVNQTVRVYSLEKGMSTLGEIQDIPGERVVLYDPETSRGTLVPKADVDYNKGYLMDLPRTNGWKFSTQQYGVLNFYKALSFKDNMKRVLGSVRMMYVEGDNPEPSFL